MNMVSGNLESSLPFWCFVPSLSPPAHVFCWALFNWQREATEEPLQSPLWLFPVRQSILKPWRVLTSMTLKLHFPSPLSLLCSALECHRKQEAKSFTELSLVYGTVLQGLISIVIKSICSCMWTFKSCFSQAFASFSSTSVGSRSFGWPTNLYLLQKNFVYSRCSEPGVLAHICNLTTWEVGTKGSRVQAHFLLSLRLYKTWTT